MQNNVCHFGFDLWIELIILNDLSNQDIFNLSLTCKFLSQLLKKEKVIQFVKDRQIYFGRYLNESQETEPSFILAWSPDNRILASASAGAKIIIWDVKIGRVKKFLVGSSKSQSRVSCLAFHSQDANLVAAAYRIGNVICLWDIQASEIKIEFGSLPVAFASLVFDPQGRFLVSCSRDTSIRIWNIETGECTKRLTGEKLYLTPHVCLTSDGKYLIASMGPSTTSNTDSIFIFDTDTWQSICPKFTQAEGILNVAPPISFQILSDVKALVLLDHKEQHLAFYDFTTGTQQFDLRTKVRNRHYTKVATHPYRKMVALGSTTEVTVWNLETKKTLLDEVGHVYDLSFSPNGRALAAAFGYYPIEVWDIPTLCKRAGISFIGK